MHLVVAGERSAEEPRITRRSGRRLALGVQHRVGSNLREHQRHE
jgi:hypothetical protein